MSHCFDTLQTAREYVFAGKAIFTLESRKTGAHYTYKVKKCEAKPGEKDPGNLYFVSQMTAGSADEGQWSYLGIVRDGKFTITKKSTANADAPSVKAFAFFMALKELHPLLSVYHTGRCGKCGRTLTVPESINSGIGPECAKKHRVFVVEHADLFGSGDDSYETDEG
jgi:hypothetical protein